MKKLLAVLIVALVGFTAMAQNLKTVHGYVLDKNGNPIPGAEVVATGGSESVITDADGSFTLMVSPFVKSLTATYAGMAPSKKSIPANEDVIFKLRVEKKHPVFVNLIGAYSFGSNVEKYEDIYESYSMFGGGVMAGQLGKWGWFGKAYYSVEPDYYDEYNCFSITAGAIKSLPSNKVYLYFGAGYGSITTWDYSEGITYNAFAVDLGLIIRPIHNLNISVGFNPVISTGKPKVYTANIGVGYVF